MTWSCRWFIQPQMAISRNRNWVKHSLGLQSSLSRARNCAREPSQIQADPILGPYGGAADSLCRAGEVTESAGSPDTKVERRMADSVLQLRLVQRFGIEAGLIESLIENVSESVPDFADLQTGMGRHQFARNERADCVHMYSQWFRWGRPRDRSRSPHLGKQHHAGQFYGQITSLAGAGGVPARGRGAVAVLYGVML